MPTRDPKLSTISSLDVFSRLSRRELAEVSSALDIVERPAGAVLTSQGERGREFFFLVEGEVEVSRDGTPLARLHAGDVVGELSVLTNGPRTATVTATTDVVLLVGERRQLHPLLSDLPALAAFVVQRAERRTLAA
jgi:CRP/FNR family transcriptional regulator, cyclic AMP receptor protein